MLSPGARFWATTAREFTPPFLRNLAESGLAICLHACLNAYFGLRLGELFRGCQDEVVQTSVIETIGVVYGSLAQITIWLISLWRPGCRIVVIYLFPLSACVTKRLDEDGKLDEFHIDDCSSFA
ncbi:unnamed protein product [Dibothriocephalus latus]|uniref:Uncharacterized protein n=1 Tax=Dibothriocephalus latus TaxID=60516 RepID=A0A3P7P0E0_DIBLA|nr:unnamed protein product [Dibothriocephalus latus]